MRGSKCLVASLALSLFPALAIASDGLTKAQPADSNKVPWVQPDGTVKLVNPGEVENAVTAGDLIPVRLPSGERIMVPRVSVGPLVKSVYELEDQLTETLNQKFPAPVTPALGGLEGLGFGVGIGVNVTSKQGVDEARIANGAVVVESESKARPQLWLEAHYSLKKSNAEYLTWNCTVSTCYEYDVIQKKYRLHRQGEAIYKRARWTYGPFFAVQVSGDGQIINGAAIGGLISWRRVAADQGLQGTAFNLGLGVSTYRQRQLANGLTDGAAAEEGTVIEYRETDEVGLLILFSVGL
ncbi:MAG: hypothetical protein ABF338_11810 [Hyphomonas sp.]